MSDEICGAETTGEGECQNPAGDNGHCWIPSHNPDSDEENPAGRPSKFNEEREKQCLKAAAMGKSKAGCARAAGIDKSTLEYWLQEHEEFSNAFRRARAQGEQQLIEGGLRDGDVDSSMAKFLLSTSFDYVKTERRELSGEGGGGIEIVLGDDSDE